MDQHNHQTQCIGQGSKGNEQGAATALSDALVRWSNPRHIVFLGLLLAVALGLGSRAVAQDFENLTVGPINPGVGDRLLASYSGIWPSDCPPTFLRDVEVNGRVVEVRVSNSSEGPPVTGCSLVPTSYRATVDFGPLNETGPYDLEVVSIDTPFLPTLLGTTSFTLGPANLVNLVLPETSNASEPGRALVFGQWLEGCVPSTLRVETSDQLDEISLVSDLIEPQCGIELVPFALAVDLPALPAGQRPVEYLVFDDVTGVQRAVGTLEIGPAPTSRRLSGQRFEVSVKFDDDQTATVAAGSTEDTALFTFFDPANLEMQVKVLNGCAQNDFYWVFGAASTDLAFTITVTDLMTDTEREYRNTAGNAAQAINDTSAFPCS